MAFPKLDKCCRLSAIPLNRAPRAPKERSCAALSRGAPHAAKTVPPHGKEAAPINGAASISSIPYAASCIASPVAASAFGCSPLR
jgi:hypothetical protein